MKLLEKISIKTPTGELAGYLYVGQDGLPSLQVEQRISPAIPYTRLQVFRPAQFPAAWELQQAEPDAGILFCAWRTIMEMQWEIAQQEREIKDVPTD